MKGEWEFSQSFRRVFSVIAITLGLHVIYRHKICKALFDEWVDKTSDIQYRKGSVWHPNEQKVKLTINVSADKDGLLSRFTDGVCAADKHNMKKTFPQKQITRLRISILVMNVCWWLTLMLSKIER